MKRALWWGWLMAAALFVPALIWSGSGSPPPAETDASPGSVSPEEPVQTGRSDGEVTVRVKNGETVEQMTLAAYLPGVVRGEMPPSFELEALKAQAVAERTFVCRRLLSSGKDAHPEADVCTDPDCCSAWLPEETVRQRWGGDYERLEARVEEAVRQTDGQILLYDGAPILAVFHSSSDGTTAASGDVWSSDLPYLQSVDSPESAETVPNYYSVVTVSPDAFAAAVRSAYPEASLSGDASSWLGEQTKNGSGRVERVEVGGVAVSGTELRRLFSLRSASFTLSYESGDFVFRVTGYGHGVGMSQYGANELARQGKSWQEILCWYYTGVSVGYMA